MSANFAGTDYPYYENPQTGEVYEGGWSDAEAYPFGYWFINGVWKLFVGDMSSTHQSCALAAIEEEYLPQIEEELQNDAANIYDACKALYNDMRHDGPYTYDADNNSFYNKEGELVDLTQYSSIFEDTQPFVEVSECGWEALRKIANGEELEYFQPQEIAQELITEWKENHEECFLDSRAADNVLEHYMEDFDSFFENGKLLGRVWFDQGIISFYYTPSPQSLAEVLHALADYFHESMDNMLNLHIIYEEYHADNNDTVECCTCGEFIGGEPQTTGDDNAVDSEKTHGKPFIPHLAPQDQKREYFADYRKNRDKALYGQAEKELGSVARYNYLRHPYGENKEIVHNAIMESLNMLIREAAMDNFSLEELSNIRSFRGKLQYCKQMMGFPIGRGSARIVFQIDDDKVLKLALNAKGIAQNEAESDWGAQQYGIFPQIYRIADDYSWIVMEYVLPAKVQDFKYALGIDWKTFQKLILTIYSQYGGVWFHGDYDWLEDMRYKSDWVDSLDTYMRDYQPPYGDLTRLSSWGICSRDGATELVILDNGLNDDVAKLYK